MIQEYPGAYHECIGAYGTVKEGQTVPRAELTAVTQLMEHLLATVQSHQAVTIYTDSSIVHEGYLARKGPSDGSLGDLWEEFWRLIEGLKSLFFGETLDFLNDVS